MHLPTKLLPLSLLFLLRLAAAQDQGNDPSVQEDLSFGQNRHNVWGEDHRSITGFGLAGEDGHHPDVLSDRIIMTPPWPGNRRASLWADHPEHDGEWSVTMEFRSTGPPYASGNMQVWYVKDKSEIKTASVYTVGKFDGLAIVIDNFGGSGGAVRGFLNDDSKSYKDHHHVDTLSFAHCEFLYRNTGNFVNIEVKQTKAHLEVITDGKECFKTSKVRIEEDKGNGLTV
jgi:lectin, mannose-binding 1